MPSRGPRPAAIELAAAILVIGGALQLVSAIAIIPDLPPGSEGLLTLSIVLDVLTIAAGVLTRVGRGWLFIVNYVAVLGFLDLLRAGSSPVALMLALADLVVLGVLLVHRPWFGKVAGPEPDES